MIKRSQKPSSAAGESETTTTNTTAIAESSDPLVELDKKYPGFKKGPGYLKLE